MANFESSVPQALTMKDKEDMYNYQKPGSDFFPPHLDIIPNKDKTSLGDIFDSARFRDTLEVLKHLLPYWFHSSPLAKTLSGLTQRNKDLVHGQKDVFTGPNIGTRDDWYSDAVFAQQQFTGPNPTTIKLAPASWVAQFATAAKSQQNDAVLAILDTSADSLYIQDCSYFRDAIALGLDEDIISDDKVRYGCAAVSLFHLNPEGKLHPLAIVIDYRRNIENSVVIFNKRLSPSASTASEEEDWPWRYAKMCAQVSDWTRHEITVHLTQTHFVEETIIVATHQVFPVDHAIFQLLSPHWAKTLSIGAAARSTLVPGIITQIVGFKEEQTYAFIRYAYDNFDWTAGYIPNDMNARGFPMDRLGSDPKFHNYAYGKDMALMWDALHEYVSSCMTVSYKSDDDVVKDPYIGKWCDVLQKGGQLSSFPTAITTVADLVDALTMCIHIASPLHTAINYLQDYYQVFLPNKPSALYKRPPSRLGELQAWAEEDIMDSLPRKSEQTREWLLATHLPHLLSYRVAEKQNLKTYAVTTAFMARDKEVREAARKLSEKLSDLKVTFDAINAGLDDPLVEYHVMDPEVTAVSILL